MYNVFRFLYYVFCAVAHTPDNSFLGFVVGSNRTNSLPPYKKKKTGLVYGKELYMWKVGHVTKTA